MASRRLSISVLPSVLMGSVFTTGVVAFGVAGGLLVALFSSSATDSETSVFTSIIAGSEGLSPSVDGGGAEAFDEDLSRAGFPSPDVSSSFLSSFFSSSSREGAQPPFGLATTGMALAPVAAPSAPPPPPPLPLPPLPQSSPKLGWPFGIARPSSRSWTGLAMVSPVRWSADPNNMPACVSPLTLGGLHPFALPFPMALWCGLCAPSPRTWADTP
mmetsp:Transcript_80144/g.247181  ORF Transcript_80144/g.247181 Transcript_80144/m.247181 type:complete len:215 (+) Transcript_80144:433-1077(+)